MALGFHAEFVDSDALVRRLTFADRNDETSQHYFVIDRSEESPEEAIPDVANVYIELDDQCWGGYGGVEQVVLRRDCLVLHLASKWANKIIGDDEIRVTFKLGEAQFQEVQSVLRLIMRGYESRLVCLG